MLDKNKLQEIANNLGVDVRFDREPGMYNKRTGHHQNFEEIKKYFFEDDIGSLTGKKLLINKNKFDYD